MNKLVLNKKYIQFKYDLFQSYNQNMDFSVRVPFLLLKKYTRPINTRNTGL